MSKLWSLKKDIQNGIRIPIKGYPYEIVCVQIYSKSGLEYYPLPEAFTGNVQIFFNQGGVSKVKKGEDLK